MGAAVEGRKRPPGSRESGGRSCVIGMGVLAFRLRLPGRAIGADAGQQDMMGLDGNAGFGFDRPIERGKRWQRTVVDPAADGTEDMSMLMQRRIEAVAPAGHRQLDRLAPLDQLSEIAIDGAKT